MNNQDTFTKVVSVIGGALALVAITLAGLSYLKGPEPAAGPAAIATPVSQEDVQSRTYQTLVYLTNGGDKQVVASGGELEIQSGGILDVQSGATVGLASLDLNGGTLTWDPTGGTTSVASTDNFITTTIGAGAGKFSVLVGNLVVGNGSPDTSLNGEDAYVEGTIEVDGAANFDGAVDINGNLTSATGAVTIADTLNATGAVDFDNNLNVDGNTTLNGTLDVDGNLTSGTGAITVADTLNVTGAADFDDNVNIDGTLASATGAVTVADTLNVTGAADFDDNINVDGTLASATGAVTVADTLNVTGAADFDDNVNVDGNATLNGTLDVDGNLTSGTGAVTVADTLQVTGLADFDSGLTFGPTPLYPLGISIASQEIECGTTTFTDTTIITPTTLNTPTYVLAAQVTAPITTAAWLYVSDPTTTTFTLTSLESDFTTGTTGVTVHYCAIGTE